MSFYPFPASLDVFGGGSSERERYSISQSDMALLSTCSWRVLLWLSSQRVHWFVPSSNINLGSPALTFVSRREYRLYALRNVLKLQVRCRTVYILNLLFTSYSQLAYAGGYNPLMPCSSSLPELNHSIWLYSRMGHLWTFVDAHACGICPEYVHSCRWYSVYECILSSTLRY